MKWFIIKIACSLCIGLLYSPASTAEKGEETPAPESGHSVKTRYEKRVDNYVSRWNRLIPRYSKIHFAGGMGVVSVGTGWDYGKKKQWETDLMIGVLPRFSGDKTSATFTIKQNYIPWRIPLTSNIFFEPLETGIFMNKLTSRDFWSREPEKYNGPYYRFATNTRFNVFVGQRLKINLNGKYAHRSLTAFYEIGSCDLYIISAFTNRSLSMRDIINISFGVKFQFL